LNTTTIPQRKERGNKYSKEMAELAIASGIAGLISLTMGIVKTTCAYTADLASAERTVLDYLVALRSLEAVLVQLRTLTETRHLKQLLAERPQALSVDAIKDCQQHITLIQEKLKKRVSEDGQIKLRHALCWPLKKKETLESIRAMQQYRDTFHAALSADILAVSAATYEELRSAKEHKGHEKILEWLTPYNIEPVLQSISSSRYPGTCQWIFENEAFKQWSSNKAQLLWCHGDPGSGKTVLSSTIVEHLSMETTTLCHICDHQSPDMHTPEAILCNLIKQFSFQQPGTPPEILAMYVDAQSNPRTGGPTKGRLLEIFEHLCDQVTDLFVVIDALDECENQRQLVQLFFSLVKAGAKVLITSRTTPDLEGAFAACSHIETRASDTDLQAYISYKLDELDEDLGNAVPTELRKTLCSTVLERSSGLYGQPSMYMCLEID
jgi:NACHT domain